MVQKICVLFVVLLAFGSSTVDASPSTEREPFEIGYLRHGYKSVNQAVKECEQHFNRNIKLPIKLPQITFTHQLARCNNGSAHVDINSELEIEYLNENKGSNHYQIWVKPAGKKFSGVPFKNDVIETFTLKDGTKAIFGTTPAISGKKPIANLLVFERDYLQYILSVDTRMEDSVSVNVLLEIAESIIN